jgi:hypothetical protein
VNGAEANPYVLIGGGAAAIWGAQYAPAAWRGPLVLGGLLFGIVGVSKIGARDGGLLAGVATDVFGASADDLQRGDVLRPVAHRPMVVEDLDGAEDFTLRQVAPAFGGIATRGLFSNDYRVRIEIGNRTNTEAQGTLMLDLDENYALQDEAHRVFRQLAGILARHAATFEVELATARSFILSPTVTGSAVFGDARGSLEWDVVS